MMLSVESPCGENVMKSNKLSKIRLLLLTFCIVNYSVTGTITAQDQMGQGMKKFGIDENGRSFTYTVPVAVVSAPSPPHTQKIVTKYGIDQNGRSFEYEEQLAPARPATVAIAPHPLRQAAVNPPKPVMAKSRGTAPVKSPPGYGKGEFIVKVSTRNSTKTASPLPQELVKLGAPTVQSRVEREARSAHRLLFARHKNQSQAHRDLETLHSRGQKGYVISKRGTYNVYCGSFYLQERARSEQKIIAAKGIRVTIMKDPVTVTSNYLMARGFRSRDAAQKLAGILQKRGVTASVMSAEQEYALKNGAGDLRG